MGEARRRKLAGDTKPRGTKYRATKPSKHRRYLVVGKTYERGGKG